MIIILLNLFFQVSVNVISSVFNSARIVYLNVQGKDYGFQHD